MEEGSRGKTMDVPSRLTVSILLDLYCHQQYGRTVNLRLTPESKPEAAILY